MSGSKHNPNESNRGNPISPDSHLTDEFLLLSIDDELSAADRETVSAHIAVCWSCRARKERFEQSVRDVVEYRNARTSPFLPPSPSGPAVFRARLDRQATELGRPSLLVKWTSGLLYVLKAPTFYRPAWLAAFLAACALLAFLAYRWHRVPVVSAGELLQRAGQDEATALSVTSKPVVCQRVRIEVNGNAVMRTIYRDPIRKRHAAKVDNASQEASAEKIFRATPFDWDDPLSPARFSDWRDRLADHRDSVQGGGTDLLTLRTETSKGAILEASLTVRSSDFHPVTESLQLHDSSRINIAELSYEIVELEALDPTIFGGPFRATAPPLRLGIKAASPALRVPTEIESAAAEVEVRAALHRIGADLGEQIEIEQTPTRHIAVNAVTADDARRHEIQSALTGIPLVQVKVRTVAEAVAEEEQSSLPPAGERGRIYARSVESTPLLDKQLRERFPAMDARASFVNQSLALAQGASARAWALRRLADRYTPHALSVLDHGSRQRLEELLSDHVGALQQDISRLQERLGVVMSAFQNTTAAANTNSAGVSTAAPNEPPTRRDWRADVRRVHSSVETANECVAVLLGGATSDGEDAEKLELRLRTTLTELWAELETLGHQIHTQL